jgi:hypothetical protein
MAEQATLNRLVGGSTPPAVTNQASSSDEVFVLSRQLTVNSLTFGGFAQ